MSPAEFLLLGLMAAVLFGGVVSATAHYERKHAIADKRRKLLQKGDVNKQEEEINNELHCAECDKVVSPDHGDVYDGKLWWCVTCWKQYR